MNRHSFGYDCKRRANLHMLDEETLIFIAGNFIQLLSIKTKQQTYLRSTSGGGIGAIAVSANVLSGGRWERGYIVVNQKKGRTFLFNNALNLFYLRL